MEDEQKTKKQLIEELDELRNTVTELGSRVKTLKPIPNTPIKYAEVYLNLIDTIQEGLAIVDGDETIIFVNKAFCNIVLYPEEELVGMNLLELIPEDEVYKIVEATKQKKETGEPTRYGLIMKRSDDELRDVLISTSPLFYKNDDYGILGIITDITERKKIEKELEKHRDNLEELVVERTSELRNINRALETEIRERKLTEEALRESEGKYRTFVQDFKGIAFRGDLNFVPMFFHGAVEEITGYSESDFTAGQPSWDQIIHPDDFSALKNSDEIRTVPDYSTEREYRIIRKDGTYRWVFETLQNICDVSRKPAYVQGTIHDITERKTAEKALRESEEKYRDLVENINDGISTVNSEGVITYASPVFERIGGFAPNEIVGKRITDFVYGPDLNKSGDILNNMLSGIGPMEAEIRVTTKRGNIRWTRITARRAFDPNGELTLKCILSNIDYKKRAEESLRIKETAIENSITGIVLTGIDGAGAIITYANASSLRMWGFDSVDEVLGRPVTDFYKNKSALLEIIKSLRNAGNWSGEMTGLKKDGFEFPLHLSVSTVFDENERPLCTISSFVDISELKLAGEALRESKERLNATLNALPDILFEVDREGRIYDFRTRFPQLLYAPPGDFINKTVNEVLPKSAADTIMKSITEAAEVGEYLGEVYSLNLPEGERWFELSVAIKGEPGNRGNRFIALARDITDRIRAEERLKKSLVEKEVLLKEINHRVKNNLAVVAGLLNLQARHVDNENARSALLESRSRIMTMAHIHKRLYGASDLADIDFGDYIRQLVIDLISASVPNFDGASIDIKIEEIKLNVNKAIPCGLIINELITNSLKYAFPEGQTLDIFIDIDRDENGIFTLIIADKGIGFPEDIDFRNTKTLGMHLVNALVTQLDATIELDRSEGTKFTIRFAADNGEYVV